MTDMPTYSESIHFKDTIINAIPRKIIRYENPSSPDIEYEIEFETPEGKIHKTDPLPLEQIVEFLRFNGLLFKIRPAEETLAQILHAYDRDGKVEITYNMKETGFYLINGKIECYGFEFKPPTKEKMKECGLLITKLVVDTYHSDERLPTLLKWFVNAPFNYIRKLYKTWMVWPF